MKVQDLIGKTIASVEIGEQEAKWNERAETDTLANYDSVGVIVFTDGTRAMLELSDPGCVWLKKDPAAGRRQVGALDEDKSA